MTWANTVEKAKRKLPDWKRTRKKYDIKLPLVCFKYRGVALCKTPLAKLTTKREEVTCPYCKKLIRERDFDILLKHMR